MRRVAVMAVELSVIVLSLVRWSLLLEPLSVASDSVGWLIVVSSVKSSEALLLFPAASVRSEERRVGTAFRYGASQQPTTDTTILMKRVASLSTDVKRFSS